MKATVIRNWNLLFLILAVIVSSSRSYVINDGTDKISFDDDAFDDETYPDVNTDIDLSTLGDNAFIQPDNETTGRLVAEYNEVSEQNPEELGAYFEGDILMPNLKDTRNGLVAKSSRWQGGIVPYVIAGTFTAKELVVINWAFNEYHKKTCIRFRPRSKEIDYIEIVNGKSGCWSPVGRTGGKQQVNLQTPSCLMKRGTAVHELMHTLGFIHEQNRYERDEFIKVRTENIKENMMTNFAKSPKQSAHAMGIGYDYGSVMHYSPMSFSKNGKPTIEAKKQSKEANLMGQRNGFSKADLAKINKMYGCKRSHPGDEDENEENEEEEDDYIEVKRLTK